MDQTYLIRAVGEGNPQRQIFFRFGNWCYQGPINLGFTHALTLSDLRLMMPILQRQQGSLKPVCEFGSCKRDSKPIAAIDTLNEIVSDLEKTIMSLDEKVEKIISQSGANDDEVTTFFRLDLTDSFPFDHFNDYEIVISKTYCKHIVMHTILMDKLLYVALSDGTGQQQLLNTQFPNLKSVHEVYEVETFGGGSMFKKISLCFGGSTENEEAKEEISIGFGDERDENLKADFQKEGYNQTYFILNPPPTSVITVIREVFFRFGNWCYHGAINVGFPQLKESTIPGLLPLLHKQQSNLHSTCQYDKLPPESKFKPLLHTFEKAARFIEVALETADEKLLKVAGDDKWVDDDWEDAFFQFETTEHHYPGVDCVINKSYSKGILLHILYIQNSYFAVLTQAADNIPLLDTLFPDISKRLQCQHNYILETFPPETGFKNFQLWIGGQRKEPPSSAKEAATSKPTVVTKSETKSEGKEESKDSGYTKAVSPSRPWVKTPMRIEPLEGAPKPSGAPAGEDNIFRKKNIFK